MYVFAAFAAEAFPLLFRKTVCRLVCLMSSIHIIHMHIQCNSIRITIIALYKECRHIVLTRVCYVDTSTHDVTHTDSLNWSGDDITVWKHN